MVREIVLAIDPALRKIEDVLLWKNKFKTGAVFTFFHFLFWLIQNFNIRTYCSISCFFLLLHLLDAYRTKKRRELIRLHSTKSNVIETMSSLGRYIIIVYDKLSALITRLNRLKQRNRLQYFLFFLVFWSMTSIIGVKIRGFYLIYLLFWVLFFVPAVLHYDLPKKILSKALPVLEQLDHSMRYERRSILDKSELLVDVKLPHSELDDQEQEDEYLKSFQLGELREDQRRAFENLEDEEDDEEIIEHDYDNQNIYEDDDGGGEEPESDENDDARRRNEELEYHERFQRAKQQPSVDHRQRVVGERKAQRHQLDIEVDADVDDISAMLPDESGRIDPDEQLENESALRGVEAGDKALRRRVKNRPSLRDYYGDSIKSDSIDSTAQSHFDVNPSTTNWKYSSPSMSFYSALGKQGPVKADNKPMTGEQTKASLSNRRLQQNEQDIDETFDFLDEELSKYDS